MPRPMLMAVRLGLVCIALGLVWLCAYRPAKVGRWLGTFFLHKSGPLSLALARIVVFFQIFQLIRRVPVRLLIEIPQVFRTYPPGWGWTKSLPLFDLYFAQGAQYLGAICALLACLGLATRVAAPIAAIAAVYPAGLEHFFFKINHGGHMLVLCALVISLSPSGRAVSLDALITTHRQGRPRLSMPSEPAVAYALPLRLCWLLFGVSYFFPGLFKAVDAGDLWVNGRAIAGHMTGAIAQRQGFSPIFPLFDYPILSSLFGIGTLVFELGFIFLLFSERFWWVAPLVGASFHLGVRALMGISFFATLKLYLVFVDFDSLALRLFRGHQALLSHLGFETSDSETEVAQKLRGVVPRFAPIAAFGGLLLAAHFFVGAAKISTFPVSVFPLFASRTLNVGGKSSTWEFAIAKKDGRIVEIEAQPFKPYATNARWKLLKRQVAEADGERQRKLVLAFAKLARKVGYGIQTGDHLVIKRATYQVNSNGPPTLLKAHEVERVRVPSAGKTRRKSTPY